MFVQKKLLLMFNPSSGKSQIKPQLWQIIDIFVKGGYDVTVYPTQKRLDAMEVLRNRAKEFDIVVVSGGDGTLSEAIQGLVSLPEDERVTLGYIPSGSTNDFGTSLGIPSDITQAAQNIVDGEPLMCDCGLFNGKPYLYCSAFGMFTDVSYETPQNIKNLLGHTAYILEGIKRLKTYTYYHMKIESDEITVEDDFILGFVTNTTSIGGMKNRSEYAPLLSDGVFECVFIKNPRGTSDIQSLLSAVVTQDFDCPNLVKFTTKRVRIRSAEPIKWTTDGEDGGAHTDVTIEVVPKAYNIIVSEEKVNEEQSSESKSLNE